MPPSIRESQSRHIELPMCTGNYSIFHERDADGSPPFSYDSMKEQRDCAICSDKETVQFEDKGIGQFCREKNEKITVFPPISVRKKLTLRYCVWCR